MLLLSGGGSSAGQQQAPPPAAYYQQPLPHQQPTSANLEALVEQSRRAEAVMPWVASSWPERFQDLASWCPPAQDELNTPQSLHDEFNFRFDRSDCTGSWNDIAPGGPPPGGVGNGGFGLNNNSIIADSGRGNKLWEPELHYMTSASPEPSFLNREEEDHGGGEEEEAEEGAGIKSGGRDLLLSHGILSSDSRSGDKAPAPRQEPLSAPNTWGPRGFRFPQVQQPPIPIKEERGYRRAAEEEEEPFWVPQMSLTGQGCQPSPRPPQQAVQQNQSRPRLRLNIVAANTGPPAAITSVDTPDIVKSLSDEATTFDILSFVNGDFDDPNVLITDPGSIVVAQGLEAVKSDHDYTGSSSSGSGGAKEGEGKEERVEVKEEPKEEEEGGEGECGGGGEGGNGGGRGRKRKRSGGWGRRASGDSSYEEDDEDWEAGDDDSVDWSPYKKRGAGGGGGGRRRRRSSGSGGGRRGGGRKPKAVAVTPSSAQDDSGPESTVSGGPDRYRELRDRNNEASRKSRLNRKQKELEMVRLAEELDAENARLKKKADSLERLVKKLREVLMNIVLKK